MIDLVRVLRWPLLVAGTAVATALAVYILLPRPLHRDARVWAGQDIPVVRVETPIEREFAVEVLGNVTILPRQEVVVAPEQAGWLRTLDAHKGQRVKAGQVLGSVQMLSNPPDHAVRAYEAAMRRVMSSEGKSVVAERSLAQALAEKAGVESHLQAARTTEAELAATVNNQSEAFNDALSSLQSGSATAERTQQLFDRGLISRDELNEAEKARATAAAEENRARVALQEAQLRLTEATNLAEKEEENVAAADGRVKQAERAVASEQKTVSRYVAEAKTMQARLSALAVGPTIPLRASVDGVLVDIAATPGLLVAPAAALARIKRSNVALAVFAPARQDTRSMKPGMPAALRIGNKQLAGKVSGVAPSAEGGIHALLQFPDPAQLLRPGHSSSGVVRAGQSNALAIPRSAMLLSDNRSSVWVVEDGVGRLRDIRVLQIVGDKAMVASGLAETDRVVVQADRPLVDGSPVKIE